MRREHDTITVEVLDHLAGYLKEAGPFHVTVLAARANLPHDRLKGYLDELSALGLIEQAPDPAMTLKGLQFLECYRAWVRIQKIYGLDPRGGRGQALRFLPRELAHFLPGPGRPVPGRSPSPAQPTAAVAGERAAVEALGVDSHESAIPAPLAP